MRHNVTTKRLAQLQQVAADLWSSGHSDHASWVIDAKYSLNCAAHEFQCITELAKHPRRNAHEIKKWAQQMKELGWTTEMEEL